MTPPTPDSIEKLRARIVPGPEQGPPAALARLVDAVTARIADNPPPADGMCQAVWRDPTDGELVACALNAEPGHDWCAAHLDRDRGCRILVFYDRADATRVQSPHPPRRTMTEPHMTPQPYPLWCAEASREHGVSVGRIIGWIPNPDELDGNAPVLPTPVAADYLPVVWAADAGGAFCGSCTPVDYEQLFIGEDRTAVYQQAKDWLRELAES